MDNYYNYTENRKKRIIYILEKLASLPDGFTLSPDSLEGYPFNVHIDRYGKNISNGNKMDSDIIIQYLKNNPGFDKKVDFIELAWKYYLVYGTPNGDLFKYNSIFNILKRERHGLPLVHITTQLDKIEYSGKLFQSMGCLGASIYCTPLGMDNKLHNLAKYMYYREIPFIQKKFNKKIQSDILIIWLDNETFLTSNMLYNSVDYLYMGARQLMMYQVFKNLYFDDYAEEFYNLEFTSINDIEAVSDFLNLCVDYNLEDVSNEKYFSEFQKAINRLSILGYIYFEVISEYVSLFQDDIESMQLHEIGELNNKNYKDLVYATSDTLKEGFKLTNFKPTINEIIEYINRLGPDKRIFSNFNPEHFLDYMKWRTAQYIRSRFMDCNYLPKNINIRNLTDNNPSILGHLFHRKLRTGYFKSGKSSLYDIFRSRKYWEYWNQNSIAIPSNSILPKGEIGINPTYNELMYKVFLCSIVDENKLEITREIKAIITPELVPSEHNNLRKHLSN